MELARIHLDKPIAMFTRHSLENLAELCKHPLFGPHIRDVGFYPLRFDEQLVYQTEYKLNTSIFNRDPTGIAEAMKELNTYLKYLEEEYHLERSGQAVELLTEIFCSLRLHGKAIGISLPGKRHWHGEKIIRKKAQTPIGYSTAVESLSHREEHVWGHVLNEDESALSLMTMLEAIVRSDCRVSSLHLHTPDTKWRDVTIEPSRIQSVSGSLENLKSIRIGLPDIPLLGGLEHILQATLSHAKGLEKLYLSSFDEQSDYMYVRFGVEFLDSATHTLGSVNSNALVHVHLEDIPVRATDLLKFLERHKHTLKELALLRMPVIGEWGDVLVWIEENIEENLHLEKLCLASMRATDELPENFEWIQASPWFSGGFGASGKDEVHLKTQRFLAYLKRWCAGDKDIDHEEYELGLSDLWTLRAKFMGAGFMDDS
ncbi:hypothetical protein KCU92_g7727, partial [Aureobasidium melanogenum]